MNWQKIIMQLRYTMTFREMAAQIGIGERVLKNLYTGRVDEPKYSKGMAILKYLSVATTRQE